MMVKIGEKIKELRRKNDITQDKMAEYLGITAQAVSRWESESGYPDIELLPAIANFFGVSADELLGIDIEKNSEKTAKIVEEVQVLWSDGLLDKCINILRNALKEFPNDYKLLQYLMIILSTYQGNGCTDYKKEAVAIGERILSDCKDEHIRQICMKDLAFTYKAIGENDKAVEMASNLPNVNSCSNVVIPFVIEKEKQVLVQQQNLQDFSEYIASQISTIADIDFINKNNLSVEQKLYLLDKINRFYELLYENGDYGFYNCRLAANCRKMAAGYLLIHDYDNALTCLEKAAEHAVEHDKIPEKYNHTSLLFNKLTYEKAKNSQRNHSYNQSSLLLNNYLLQQERYDPIRNTGRFKAVIEKLQEYAK